jgi:site-specific recombinase XerD
MGAGRYLPPEWTRQQVVTDFLTQHGVLQHLSRNTIVLYGRVLDWLSAWLYTEHDTLIEDATPEQLAAWRETLTVGPASILTYFAAVKGFYHWAYRAGRTTDPDPTWSIPLPRRKQGLPRPISEADFARALDLAPKRIRPWLALAGGVGARCEEIANLDRTDVMDTARPHRLIRLTGKGGKSRVVPLVPWVWEELLMAGLPRRGPLFPRADGRPGRNRPATISQVGNEYLQSIGIEATMHMARHRFGTVTLATCHDIRIVQALMGHANLNTTAIYTAYDSVEAYKAVMGTQPQAVRHLRAVDVWCQETQVAE